MKNDNLWELCGMIEMNIDNEEELVHARVSILNLTENDLISKIEAKQPILAIDTSNQHESNNNADEGIETVSNNAAINNNINILIEYYNRQSVNDPAILCYLIQLACYEKLNSSGHQYKPDDQWIVERQVELSNRYEKWAAERNSIRIVKTLRYHAKQLEPPFSIRKSFLIIFFATVIFSTLYKQFEALDAYNGGIDRNECIAELGKMRFVMGVIVGLVHIPTIVCKVADFSIFPKKETPMLKFMQPPSPPTVSATCSNY